MGRGFYRGTPTFTLVSALIVDRLTFSLSTFGTSLEINYTEIVSFSKFVRYLQTLSRQAAAELQVLGSEDPCK
jgi:hypothetical protein